MRAGGSARCARSQGRMEQNDVCVVDGPTILQAGDLQMPRAPCSRKIKPDAACMYVRTSFDMYSDRHALGRLLLCAGVIALCCARGTAVDY